MYSESSAKNPYDTPPTQPTRDDVFDDKDTKTQSIRPTSVSRPYDFEVPSGLHDSKGRQNSGNSGYDTPADYNQNQYSTKGLNDSQDAGLVANASAMPRSDNYHDLGVFLFFVRTYDAYISNTPFQNTQILWIPTGMRQRWRKGLLPLS